MFGLFKKRGAKMGPADERDVIRERGERELAKVRRDKDDPERWMMALGCARTAVMIWKGFGEEAKDKIAEAESLREELEGKVARRQLEDQAAGIARIQEWAAKHGIAAEGEGKTSYFLMEGLWKVVVQKSQAKLWDRGGVPQRREPYPGALVLLNAEVWKLQGVPGVLSAELKKIFRVRHQEESEVTWTGEVLVTAEWGRRTFTIEV